MDRSCEHCEDGLEDSIHALWFFDCVKPIWMTDSSSSIRAMHFSKFNELFLFVLPNVPLNKVAFFAMTAWAIWERGNKLRERQPTCDIGVVFARVPDLLKEFHDVHKKIPRMVSRSEDIWWLRTCDIDGLYKTNFDRAIFEDQACAGLGVVIRDSAGLIIGALSQKIRLPSLVVMVEALATSRAINFTKEITILRVVIKGDSLQVIKAINNTKPSKTSYGHVIDEIKLLSSTLTSCSFVHVRCEGN